MPKILIIEDEAAIRRVLTKIISEENDSYQVEEAEDGLSGVELIAKNDYDLVLCDIKMPKMDGVEVLEKARKIKPEIPITKVAIIANKITTEDLSTALLPAKTIELKIKENSKLFIPSLKI